MCLSGTVFALFVDVFGLIFHVSICTYWYVFLVILHVTSVICKACRVLGLYILHVV